MDCVTLSTFIGSSQVKKCPCAVVRACSTSVRASAVNPETAQARCESISMIFSMLLDSNSGDCTRFSTPRITPSAVWMPTVVEPSWAIRHAAESADAP